MEYRKTQNNLNFPAKQQSVFAGFMFSGIYEKTSEIDISQDVQTGFHLSWCFAILTGKKAPVAVIKKSKT